MRRHISLLPLVLLVIICVFCLSACGNSMSDDIVYPDRQNDYYWRTDTFSTFPLGVNSSITGVAVNEDTIFVCGNDSERPLLAIMRYELSDNKCNISEPSFVSLSELPEESRAINVNYGAGWFYVLLSAPNSNCEGKSFLVNIYQPDGTYFSSLNLTPGADSPKTITVLNDGSFWTVGEHTICLYDTDGNETARYSDYSVDFESAFPADGELVFLTYAYEDNKSRLNSFDFETDTLMPIITEYEISVPTAICNSVFGAPLICSGDDLLSVNDDYSVSHMLSWTALFDSTTEYRYITQLDEDTYLLVPRDDMEIVYQMEGVEYGASGELILLTKAYVPDERSQVNIAFYGMVTELMGVLGSRYVHYSPDHRVSCINYGADEAGLERLMRDLATSDKIDIVVSDGYSIDSKSGFADLYPYIDSDNELSRADFVPQVVDGTESNGELHTIWGGFNLNTFVAFGELAEAATPLRLSDCQAYLESIGFTEPLFGDWMTKTTLLSWLAPGMLDSAYDSETNSYDMTYEGIYVLLELCKLRPDELNYDNPYISEVLEHTDLQPDYFNNLVTSGKAFRLFDGSDGGDSFTSMNCDYQSGYLIPESCSDKENAWSFMRLLLTKEHQLRDFDKRRVCYPSNVHALESVLRSYNSDETEAGVYKLIENASIRTAEYDKVEAIFTESVMPYLYGDAELDAVLNIAQGKLNIFVAERGE